MLLFEIFGHCFVCAILGLPVEFSIHAWHVHPRTKKQFAVEDKRDMSTKPNYARFDNLKFEDFRILARDYNLSRYEKIGFPDSYRSGCEAEIFSDIANKLTCLNDAGTTILDIGCGCSDLPSLIMARAAEQQQTLLLLDSQEMLDLLPSFADHASIRKIAARYPNCPELFRDFTEKVDGILVYSVFQYVFVEGNIFDFLDRSLALLAPNGRMLIGDIPNTSMRKRFFSSGTGIAHHQTFTNTQELPTVNFNRLEPELIDDAVVLGLAARARAAGFHAFIVPQSSKLPMANRREDLLLIRP